jgi:glycosyltransferase involved in cell wall biosynthesis
LKILLIVTGLGMGGAEKVVCELADQLYLKGHHVTILYLTGKAIRLPKYPIEIKKISLTKGPKIFLTIKNILNLVNDLKPDVIHSHMFHANIVARLIKFFYKNIRVICSSHSNFEGGRLRMNIYRMTENLCDVHTNVSKNAAKKLELAGATKNKKIIPIYNGINISHYKNIKYNRSDLFSELGIDPDKKIIMTIGRIDIPKDYPNLLHAFKLVTEKISNIHLVIVGDGPLKTEIVSLSKKLGIYNQVSFTGIRQDIPQLLNACDLFVSASAWEGFGIAILEAMICRKPIISTATDGAKELLHCHRLVPCNNYISLANRLIQELEEMECSVEYHNIYEFSWKKIVDQWELIYVNE